MLLSSTLFLAANRSLARAVDVQPRCLRALPAQSRPLFVNNTAISLQHFSMVGGSQCAQAQSVCAPWKDIFPALYSYFYEYYYYYY